MTPATPDLTGHPDGFCVRFGSEVVAVWPTFKGATHGLRAARQALSDLNNLLTSKGNR